MIGALSIVGIVVSIVFIIVLYVYTWACVLEDFTMFDNAAHPVKNWIWIIVNSICIASWFAWSWIYFISQK